MLDPASMRGFLRSAGQVPRPRPRSTTVGGLALLVVLSSLSGLQAQVSRSPTLSADGMTLAASWWMTPSAAGGYSPIQVELANPGGPRQVRIAVETSTFPGQSDVSRVVDLDRNSRVRVTLSVPLLSNSSIGRLKISERGRELDKLAVTIQGGWWTRGSETQTLVISRGLPDLRLFDAAQVTTQVGSGGAHEIVLPPEELPTKWIDYTALDLVIVSARDLEQMPAASRDAIRAWTLTGGNLLIYGLGADRERAAVLHRLLDLDLQPAPGTGWRRPRPHDRNVDMGQPSSTAPGFATRPALGPGGLAASAPQPAAVMPPSPSSPPAATAGVKPHFSVRAFGFGQLVAVSTDDPFPGSILDWAWVLKTLGNQRLNWSERHGMTERGANPRFWNFLIPGVGRAPVVAFEVLITVFALVIGPVNYWVLSRRKRLSLLLATVPALAVLTTVLLLGYAIASDGFAIRSRVRSVTRLDQVRGEAVSWSRISAYAGLAPSDGLHFSPDTAVYPLEPDVQSSARRVLDWTDDQHLVSGWLRSRTPTQFLTVAYRPADEQLVVRSDSHGGLAATNHLGARIRLAVVADDRGGLHAVTDLDRGAAASLAPRDLKTAAGLGALVRAQPLEKPPEIEDRTGTGSFLGRRSMDWTILDSADSAPGVLDQVLGAIADRPTRVQTLLRPRTYLAVVDRPPPLELGVRKTRDAGSLYLIWGSY